MRKMLEEKLEALRKVAELEVGATGKYRIQQCTS